MTQTQSKQQPTALEKLAKKGLILLYLSLWLLAINFYFTFTPVEHKFITRYWLEEKKNNGVIIRSEKWKLNLTGIEVPTKFSIKEGDKWVKKKKDS